MIDIRNHEYQEVNNVMIIPRNNEYRENTFMKQ